MTKPASPKYTPEVRDRAVRMVFEHEGEHASQWAAISSIVAKIGCNPETLRNWVRQAERKQGKRPGPTTDEQERIKALERVNRKFQAPRPNALWVADFRYVATWQGFVYVAFVIDTFARRIVGWRVSSTAHAGFVLDALEQALHDRRPAKGSGLIHHSDRGAQYVAIRYTERLTEAGVEPSVGSVGVSYDNALAETINGLYKAEVIRRGGPWRTLEAVEFATLEWVDWFNHRRLLEPIGNIPPAEAEARYYAQTEDVAMAA
ncbi:transposase InsO family protein [Azospirillum lipoferum]|uniref:IS3 family transposase n=1 Tax=Azospirillum lipoferum TaxID=193 RepID=A0A5A9GNU7_AZOLI|nr:MULTISPECIES: IS3 family transposase [Azospirillum]KAA0596060.1 IS3 family transposase [Azospirillum lipoferum]MCP1610996.1 transposase InsO family protein [Azospirillum lipoferum]MDW5533871.1 IS3 family transposase [Azospirillum sp. NL1]